MHQSQSILDVLLYRQHHHRHRHRHHYGRERGQDPDLVVKKDPCDERFWQQNIVRTAWFSFLLFSTPWLTTF